MMEEFWTENRRLLTRYLGAVGCDTLAGLLIVTELWDEDAVLEMLEFCKNHPDANQEQLLKASSEISSRIVSEEEMEE